MQKWKKLSVVVLRCVEGTFGKQEKAGRLEMTAQKISDKRKLGLSFPMFIW